MRLKAYLILSVSLLGLVTGCGIKQTGASSQAPKIDAITEILPQSVQAHLSSAQSREHPVKKLPLQLNIGTNTKSILYIASNEGYAIHQFVQVWGQLKQKPTVVWTSANQSETKALWTKEGYYSDPLPSSNTYYTSSSLATPDAYVKNTKTSWKEEPGILTTSQITFWVSFFK